jgi:AcrR family transcriptional regulator
LIDAQRERLLDAMLVELGEKGFSNLSVSTVLSSVSVSEAVFEKEFGNKEACLFAAYDALTERIVDMAAAKCGNGDPWAKRACAGLRSLLEELAAKPEMANVMMRTFPGISPGAYQRYVDLLERFQPLVREGREYSDLPQALSPRVELLSIGAAEAIIFAEVDAGRAARLPAMVPEILFSLLVPFMGPERASEEMRSASVEGT